MPSMSTWSSRHGFNIRHHDYSLIDNHIDEMLALHSTSLESEYRKIDNVSVNLKLLRKYFSAFLCSLPLSFRVCDLVFFTNDLDDLSVFELFIVDSRSRELSPAGSVLYGDLTTANHIIFLSYLLHSLVLSMIAQQCQCSILYSI